MANKSNTTALVVLGAALFGWNFLRQGQTVAQVLTTGRLAGFRLIRFRGTTLDCEAQIAFTNTHPTRSTVLNSLNLTVSTESGNRLFTVLQHLAHQLVAGSTTIVKLPVTLDLIPVFLQAIDVTAIPGLLRSFTSLSAVMTWITQRAGLRNCVFAGHAQVEGIVVPIRHVMNIGNPPPAAKPAPNTSSVTA